MSTTNERRPIPAAPGYSIDRLGQVYRTEGARALRVPSDAHGRLKLFVGRSCRVLQRREILGIVWPEEPVSETIVSTLDKIEAEAVAEAKAEAPTVEVDPEPASDTEPEPEQPQRKRRRRAN